jgi:cystathionine beta-lyase
MAGHAADVATSGPVPFDVPLGTLRRRTSTKWREAPADVLPLWVAEMDVMLAEPVARALHDAVDLGDTGYPHGTAFAEAFASFAAQRWGWDGVAPARAAVVPDVMLGIVEALRLVTGPGDAVAVTSPVYPPFYSFVEHMGRAVVEAPLGPQGRIDTGALEEVLGRGDVKALLIANPHNPTGAVHTPDELAAVARAAAANRVRVISDEIHSPLVLPGARFTPYLSVDGSADAFAVVSASKAWNLAGLKAALLLAGPDAAPDLERLPEEVSHGPSHLGVIAHTAAFLHGSEWLDGLLAALDSNRRLLGQLLHRHLPGVRWMPPEGTYLAWLDCRELGLGRDGGSDGRGNVHARVGPAAAFLDEGRVLLSAGPAFGNGGEGHVRLNFACSAGVLAEAVQRMAGVVDRHRRGDGGAA